MNHSRVSPSRLITALFLAAGIGLGAGCSQKSADDYLSAARQYQEAQNTDAAILAYKNAIQADPQSAQARFELGKLYYSLEQYASAEKELNRAMELGHPPAEVIPMLSMAYQQTGAQNALTEIDHQVPEMTAVERVEVGFYKLQALAELDQVAEAKALISELSMVDTTSVYKGLVMAYSDILDKQYANAVPKIEALREQSPLNKDVLILLARLYLITEQTEQAIATYSDYLRQYPKDANTRFTLAALLVDKGQLKDAQPHVDELLALNPVHPLLNQFKGIILAGDNQCETALEHFNTAIQNGRNDPVIRLIGGYCAYQLQDYEQASRHLAMIGSDLPPNHPGLRMLADSLLQTGESQEASSILKRLDGSTDADATLFSKAGYQLLREGKVKDAEGMIQRTSELSTTADDLTRLGILQLSVNDVNGIVNLEAAVEKSPESETSQQTLATAYLLTQEYDKAIALAQNWQKSDPTNPAPWLLEAEVAAKRSDFSRAAEILQKAKQIAPDSVEVALAGVNLLIQQEQFDTAKQTLQDILAKHPSNVTALSINVVLAARMGDSKDAIAKVRAAQQANPQSEVHKVLLAKVLLTERQYAEAEAALSGIKPDRATLRDYWDAMGQALMRQNKVQESVAHYNNWLEIFPNDKTATLGLLLIMDVQGQHQRALALTQSFQAQRPDRQMRILEAYFHAMLRQIREARQIVNGLTDGEKALPFVRGIQARLQLFSDQAEAAIPNALAAYEAVPNVRNMILALACYEVAGQTEAGMTFLKDFLQNNPNDPQANMLYAERLIATDADLAIKTYEKTLEISPDNFVVLNNLAFLKYEKGDLDGAETLARKAVSIQPRNPETVDTLAQILVKKGDVDAAIKLYDGVVTDEMANEEVYLNYVDALLRQDKKILAKRKLDARLFETDESRERVRQLIAQYDL